MSSKKELLERIALLEVKEKRLNEIEKELFEQKENNYRHKRLFSNIFDRLQITSVKNYKVYKSLTDGKVLFDIKNNDGTSYTYKVELVSTCYEEDLNGNVQTNETRQD